MSEVAKLAAAVEEYREAKAAYLRHVNEDVMVIGTGHATAVFRRYRESAIALADAVLPLFSDTLGVREAICQLWRAARQSGHDDTVEGSFVDVEHGDAIDLAEDVRDELKAMCDDDHTPLLDFLLAALAPEGE